MRFSVIMPTFNKQAWIAEAIESILNQTFKDWELIIIDDGSTDHTKCVVEHYLKDKRIQYHKKPNTGIADTRNFGNKLAKGEYIVVQDSDDLSHPNRLYVADKYLKAHSDTDYFYTGINLVSINAQRVSEYWPASDLTADKLRNGNQVVNHATSVYRRSLALKTPYREEQRINDDFWFITDWWNAGYKFGFLDVPSVFYRVLASGVSSSNFQKIRNEIKEKLLTEKIKDRTDK